MNTKTKNDGTKLLTAPELAEMAGCHIQTIYYNMRRGWLKPMPDEPGLRFSEDEAARWIEERKNGHPKPGFTRPVLGFFEYYTDEAAMYLRMSVSMFKYYLYQTDRLKADRREGARLVFTKETLDKSGLKREPGEK